MKRAVMAAMWVSVSLLAACASTTFHESASERVYRGKGGDPQKIDGLDVYVDSAPDRPYRIIGYVDDERAGSLLPMTRRLGDIATQARRAGGEAVVINGPGSQASRATADGFGAPSVFDSGFGDSGTGVTHGAANTGTSGSPMFRTTTRAAVIRFVQ